MSTLVLTTRRIEDLHSGYDLRVAHLCAHTPGPVHLLVVPWAEREPAPPGIGPTIDAGSIFDTVEELPALQPSRPPLARHLRLTDDHFLARSTPMAFRAARDRLHAVVRDREVDTVVAFGGHLGELARTLPDRRLVLDVCDSDALTRRRALDSGAPTGRELCRQRIALHRVRATEGRLPRHHTHVTTISEIDSAEIRRLAGGPGNASNVATVPNGVHETFLAPMAAPGGRRGVVFWGNLEFAPNAEALTWFVHGIHLPLLRAAGVELLVVGARAPGWLTELAAGEPSITLTGFVDDLRTAVTPYPIMINPMRTGSGLKNKVLEAFGLGLAVVSTPLGVEGFPDVVAGEHVVTAADPAGFAAAVLDLLDDGPRRAALRANANALVHERYRWSTVGRRWQELLAVPSTARR